MKQSRNSVKFVQLLSVNVPNITVKNQLSSILYKCYPKGQIYSFSWFSNLLKFCFIFFRLENTGENLFLTLFLTVQNFEIFNFAILQCLEGTLKIESVRIFSYLKLLKKYLKRITCFLTVWKTFWTFFLRKIWLLYMNRCGMGFTKYKLVLFFHPRKPRQRARPLQRLERNRSITGSVSDPGPHGSA